MRATKYKASIPYHKYQLYTQYRAHTAAGGATSQKAVFILDIKHILFIQTLETDNSGSIHRLIFLTV